VVASHPRIPTFGIYLSSIDDNEVIENLIFNLGIAILRKIKEIEELRGGVLLVSPNSDFVNLLEAVLKL